MFSRWSVVLAVGWVCGLWLGSHGWLPYTYFIGCTAISVVIGVFYIYFKWSGFRIVILLVAMFSAASYMGWTDERNSSFWTGGREAGYRGHLVGNIVSRIETDGNRIQFQLKTEQWDDGHRHQLTEGEKVLVRLYAKKPKELNAVTQLKRGDRLHLAVKLVRPPEMRNPGGFDYRRYLYYEHIHWIAEPIAFSKITYIGQVFHPLSSLDRLSQFLSSRIETVYSEPSAGLVRAMILGERKAIDVDVERNFSTLGLLHLLAISGLHVGIVSALIFGGLKWVGFTREKAGWIALFCLPVYALVTGANPPVIRAAISGGLVLLAIIFKQWKDSVHFLSLAAVTMLIWNPYWLFSASFQLSFIITFGIVIGVLPLSERIPLGSLGLRQVIATTVIAQLCSFPLIIYYFNEFSLLSGVANFIIVPIVSSIVIPLSFITVVLGGIAVPLATLPAVINRWCIDGVLFLTDKLAEWDMFHVVWTTPSPIWIGLYFLSLGGLYFAMIRRDKLCTYGWRIALVTVFFVLLYVAYYPYPWWNRPLTVTFLDVGQGDAIVIETPKRQTIVVDAGGMAFFPREDWEVRRQPFDTGKNIVVPYLRHQGIRHIDYLVMSHGDADHIGGMRGVIEKVPVRAFVRGPDSVDPSDIERDLIAAVVRMGIPVFRAESGSGWELEPRLFWQFVQPNGGNTPTTDRNAQSVIVRLEYEGRSLLLTGDADQATEQAMLETWRLPPVDVLKAGHHGSDTSTGEPLLKKLRPKAVILSVGANNRYNHPHPEVMKRLEQANTAIFRTDEQGAIVVRIYKGGKMTIDTTVSED